MNNSFPNSLLDVTLSSNEKTTNIRITQNL